MKVLPLRIPGLRKEKKQKKGDSALKTQASRRLKALSKLPKPPQWPMPPHWFQGNKTKKPARTIRFPVKWPLARTAASGMQKETQPPEGNA